MKRHAKVKKDFEAARLVSSLLQVRPSLFSLRNSAYKSRITQSARGLG